jgi:hypothetical protein
MNEPATLIFKEGAPQDWQRAAQAIAAAYPGATLVDAGRAVRAGNGFLDLNLPGESLEACRESLRQAGFECEVIPITERATPARPVLARRLRLAEALEVVEPPAEPLDWPGVALLHVARVQPKVMTGEGLGARDAAEASALGVASVGMLVGAPVPMSTVARAANKADAGRSPPGSAAADLYCDLCHADGRRVRIRMGAFTYDCLPPPMATLARDNFAKLLRELASRTKGAVLSPAMREALSAQNLMRFGEPTSEEDYERQIVWLLTRERVWPSARGPTPQPAVHRVRTAPGSVERSAGPGEAAVTAGPPGRAPRGPRAEAERRPPLQVDHARQVPTEAVEVRLGVSRELFWARIVFVALLVLSVIAWLRRPSPEEARSTITGASMKAGPMPRPEQVEWPPLGPVQAGTPLLASATAFRLELRWPLEFPEAKRTEVLQQVASGLPGYNVRQRNAGGSWFRGLWRSVTLRKAAEPPEPPALDYEHVILEPLGQSTAELMFRGGAISGRARDEMANARWGTVLDFHLDSSVSVHAVKLADEAVAEAAQQLGAWVRDPVADVVMRADAFANARVATWEANVPDAARHGSIVLVSGIDKPHVEVRGLRKFGLPVIHFLVPDGLPSERARLVARVLAQTLVERPAPTSDGELKLEVDALTHEGVKKAVREDLPADAPGTVVLSASLQGSSKQEPILRVSWPGDARDFAKAFFGSPPEEP